MQILTGVTKRGKNLRQRGFHRGGKRCGGHDLVFPYWSVICGWRSAPGRDDGSARLKPMGVKEGGRPRPPSVTPIIVSGLT
jgi:hypothetical protein